MSTTSSPDRRLTYADFLQFPDDGLRHELIDGVHYVTPSPVTRHQVLVGRLHFALELYLRARPGSGQVFLAPLDVVLSNWDVVEPDLFLITGNQPGIVTAKNVQGAPALVIEVLSPGTRSRDQRLKRDLFERTGVREYWVVDPDANTVAVYRRSTPDGFEPAQVLAGDENLVTPVLPGFGLSLRELFA